MAAPPPPEPTSGEPDTSFQGLLGGSGADGSQNEGMSVGALVAAIGYAFATFAAQLLVFLLLRMRLSRIYRPRSYLVPERERVPMPPSGLFGWLRPIFETPNLQFIQKCGLDAYFFMRYLRMMVKIFLPLAVIILPILLPINQYSGVSCEQNAEACTEGLDKLAIGNVAPTHTRKRLWAHLILAIMVIVWVCFVVYKELRGYIRVRQAFLTSPQHRIRASATTVLVTEIPKKWLTIDALNGLYDVFPGGIKNIWINRNYDDLSEKVSQRDKYARSLEGAETDLIKKCRKAHTKKEAARLKQEGKHKKSKREKREEEQNDTAVAEQMAQEEGVSAGNQHHVAQNTQDMLRDVNSNEEKQRQHVNEQQRYKNPLGLVGQGLGNLGRGVGAFGQRVIGGVDDGFHGAAGGINNRFDRANQGTGFVFDDDELYKRQSVGVLLQSDSAPSPPPKDDDERPQSHWDSLQSRCEPQPNPLALSSSAPIDQADGSPGSEKTEVNPNNPSFNLTRPSGDTKPKESMQIEEPLHGNKYPMWKFWKTNDRSLAMPSPRPHVAEDDDEFPLHTGTDEKRDGAESPNREVSDSKWWHELMFWKSNDDEPKESYDDAFSKDWDEDQDGEPRWREFIEPKDRDTMRLALVDQSWFPSMPLVGQKVDKIYYLRRELARLNHEIETDQDSPEKYPLMNSAFIQFNHQVAAHMACQSVSHHVPQQMAPRMVEISPEDVIWDNMSIRWWERYLRTFIVLALSAGLIVLYAIPVTFSSLLSNLDALGRGIPWMSWVRDIPDSGRSIIQGIFPPLLLAIILALVPIIFRVLVTQQGVPTGSSRELGVQQWYFAFLFVQVFFVVSISGSLIQFFTSLTEEPTEIPQQLARTLPSAANYFFSYLMIQSLSNSASALLQVAILAIWFLLAPVMDATPREKWTRQTRLNFVRWGSFFPPFTNFAVIGLVYSVIAPLMLVFMLIIFSLFWIVYRYNVFYVYQFRTDTGGLLFPAAINQLMTGLYVMEICLIGLFFIKRDEDDGVSNIPHAIIMIIVLVFTVIFHYLLNMSFSPLFRYLPVTLEDEAVIRDEAFARAQASKFAPLQQDTDNYADGDDESDSGTTQAATHQANSSSNDKATEAGHDNPNPTRQTATRRQSTLTSQTTNSSSPRTPKSPAWHRTPRSPNWATENWKRAAPSAVTRMRNLATARPTKLNPHHISASPKEQARNQQDPESQHTVGDVLFSGFADELEDLTPEERDTLVRYAFQHSALRARRPVVWIPRDKLGVSDDEIKRAKKMSTVRMGSGEGGDGDKSGSGREKTNIWMSNEGTALDGKGRVVFRRSPPDFSNVDLIKL
ncbi:hypothetical protein MBLNU230_g8292t1 [Neophaeotheca triangularis]